MSADICLFDLVNLSIGTPEAGAVNFNALHTLLHSILDHLKIKNLTVELREWDVGQDPRDTKTSLPREGPSPYHCMTDRLLEVERKIVALERLPSAKELLSGGASGTITSVNDIWQLMQLRRKVETNEEGVSKCMTLIQDLIQVIQGLKETRDNLKKEVGDLQNQLSQVNVDQLDCRITVVEQYCHLVDDLDSFTRELREKVALYPHPEEFSQCVTWEVMQATLVNNRQKMKKDRKDTPLNPMGSPTVGPPGMSDSTSWTSPDLGGSCGVPLPRPLMTSINSLAERYPETVEALRDIGWLLERHEGLEARVEHLERGKTDRAQVQQLTETHMGEISTPENTLEQVNDLKTLIETVMEVKQKVSKLEHFMDTVRVSVRPDLGEVVTQSESWSSQDHGGISDPHQLQQQCHQIANLRQGVQQLEEEVGKLKKDLMALKVEQKSSADKAMQDQLDSLRSNLEDLMTSSPAMLSWSLQREGSDVDPGQEGLGHRWGPAAGRGSPGGPSGQAGPTSPSSMVDLSRKMSQLFQRYEKLHGMVTGFIKQESDRTEQSIGISLSSSPPELISHIQGAVLQLQLECEKLHSTTSQLMEAHVQKQSHIDHLYQTMQELEEKKADKEKVEMEIGAKADKRALESKVSRLQYDAMTEQLNGMFQELLNKVTGHEQDWHKVIEKISKEMECKLNRIELDPLKKQLEDRWKSIHTQLQTQPAPDHDDAAGLRKQLVEKFHCISCDRPVNIVTPGPPILTVPFTPRLPSRWSSGLHTVYELEHIRQRNRSQRVTERADYGYLPISRSCGGRHTLTSPTQRYSRLRCITRMTQTEDDHLVQPEEVDILGLDGHIYKGRLNSRAVETVESRLLTQGRQRSAELLSDTEKHQKWDQPQVSSAPSECQDTMQPLEEVPDSHNTTIKL
ncbi:glutamine-rich protein 2-like [Brachyhypopomus gauderio]|uniref:glutamine-rich protein 2-like n=1 Tax=Brachyhypopomus gauderio TaxID=698409 RepID=UPI004041C585